VILTTGGTGMAGSFIVRQIQQRGHAVRVLARPESAAVAEEMGADVALGDLADTGSLRDAAQGVAGIVHVACTLSNDPTVDIAAMETLLDAWDQGRLCSSAVWTFMDMPNTCRSMRTIRWTKPTQAMAGAKYTARRCFERSPRRGGAMISVSSDRPTSGARTRAAANDW